LIGLALDFNKNAKATFKSSKIINLPKWKMKQNNYSDFF
jgi:hypothetical protein